MNLFCWWRKKVVRCGVTEVLDIVCGICSMLRCIVAGLQTGVTAEAKGPVHSVDRKR